MQTQRPFLPLMTHTTSQPLRAKPLVVPGTMIESVRVVELLAMTRGLSAAPSSLLVR